MLALLANDVVHYIKQGGRQEGKVAFSEFLARMDRCYRERLTDIAIMVEEGGERAAPEFVVHGEYLATGEGLLEAHGQRYVLPAGTFFKVADGLNHAAGSPPPLSPVDANLLRSLASRWDMTDPSSSNLRSAVAQLVGKSELQPAMQEAL